MRGNPIGLAVGPVGLGSIPAHAGEPLSEAWPRSRWRVYPRACGGTTSRSRLVAVTVGLSPRMRGNLRRGDRVGESLGSIPAHAGEPRAPASAKRRPRVYPRACGGTLNRLPRLHFGVGLSPRMRGNPLPRFSSLIGFGSIPAHAGEPPAYSRCGYSPRVYPRACGGTGEQFGRRSLRWGLSPRMRGNP